MARNRYIRDKYKSRTPQRSANSPRIRPAPSSRPGGKKGLFLICALAIAAVILLIFLFTGQDLVPEATDQGQRPDLSQIPDQPQDPEAALYQQALELPADDFHGRVQIFNQLAAMAPDNQEYLRQAELAQQGLQERRQALLDQLDSAPEDDNATRRDLYAQLLALEPDNAEYLQKQEFYARRLEEAARQEEEALYSYVLEVPAEDVETNLRCYARLLELDPGEQLYRDRYEHYAAKMREQSAEREQLLLEQVLMIPVDDAETNMLYYQELMELNPDEPDYRERYDHYAAAFEEQRAAQEQALFDQVRQVPADDYETNMVLYEQLMDLNPDEPAYREKYQHYLTKFYESQGLEPPGDSALDSRP